VKMFEKKPREVVQINDILSVTPGSPLVDIMIAEKRNRDRQEAGFVTLPPAAGGKLYDAISHRVIELPTRNKQFYEDRCM